MLIYSITNSVNGKIYIGQTTKTLDERIKNHHNAMTSGKDTHLYRAMRKYGWDKFTFKVIAYAETQEMLDELEAYYIAKLDTIRKGYNMAKGGSINVMYSEVVAKKHDEKMRTDEVRQKISTSMKKSYEERGGVTDSHRQHLSENKRKFYASERGLAARKKFSETFRLSPEHKKALVDSLKKQIDCYNESGDLVMTFSSVKEAVAWYISLGHSITVKAGCTKLKRYAESNKYLDGYLFVYRV